MTSNSPERQLFNAYKHVLIKHLGDQGTDDQTINRVGSNFFGKQWGGVHPVDRVKIKPHNYYVVNTDTSGGPGVHWIGLYTSSTHAYIWDSYARNPAKIVPKLVKTIAAANYKLGKTDNIHRMEQIGVTSGTCGVVSLAWLLVVRALGIDHAKNI